MSSSAGRGDFVDAWGPLGSAKLPHRVALSNAVPQQRPALEDPRLLYHPDQSVADQQAQVRGRAESRLEGAAELEFADDFPGYVIEAAEANEFPSTMVPTSASTRVNRFQRVARSIPVNGRDR